MTYQTKNNRVSLYIILALAFFVIFAATGVALFFTGTKKVETPPSVAVTVTPTVAWTRGYLSLQTAGNVTRFPAGQPVNLTVVADSGGENIVGWDLLVAYDPAAFEFIRADSILTDFKIYSFQGRDYVSLTSIKSLQSNTPAVFKKTVVASLVFQPKKKGRFTLTLKDSLGKEKTNFVNTVTKRISPQLNQITIEIY